ncbi:hypothetical protein [Mesorhizobium sp. L-8-3]|uniref:hypothetical protein n=1 Tax=Mesorhizobium sp. L-8-3 TaxID=2744522 RepID=UPI0019271A47|nr:hypothetical protein [Mesorhizobium sp. L-8-3]BCH26167.1 hypothetical protein MesoLjLb_59520 [Mesorhizobium sp. L-8-3]
MKMPTIGVAMLVVLAPPAVADIQYDCKLEQAVLRIVADKIGTLRGGFAHDVKPALVLPPTVFSEPAELYPAAPTGSTTHRHGWELMLAIEHRASRFVAF